MIDDSLQQEWCLYAGWLVGFLFYLFLAVGVMAEDGLLALPFQIVVGWFVSMVLVSVAHFLGFVLRRSPLAQVWYSSGLVPSSVIIGAVLIVVFGQSLGLTAKVRLEDYDVTVERLHPLVAYGGLFAAVFGTVHFATGKPAGSRPSRAA